MVRENPSTSSSSRPNQAPQSRVPRCPQCKPHRDPEKNTRNLVVCMDGTVNKFGQKNTNVVKLFAQINQKVQSSKQFAYYSSGIGRHPNSFYVLERMKRGISDALDMAVAWNIEEIVKDAYCWLAEKYEDGDQIYLFGFSRGAYQVRVLAGMIYEVGLIRIPTEKLIGEAYNYFEAIRSGKPETRQITRQFKNVFSWDLRVHFIGVWDTVSSVGLVRGDLFLSTSSSAAYACHIRHALALDERRVKFMPEYFREMNSQTDGKKSKYIISPDKGEHTASPAEGVQQITDDSPADCSAGKKNEPSDTKEVLTGNNPANCSAGEENETPDPDIKEVWFAGCHSDVGGVSKYGRSHLSGNVSLLWMRREARQNGLELQPTDLVWVPADLDLGTGNSMSSAWSAVEYMPITHQVSFTSGSGKVDRRPHLSRPRRIIPGQKVHASILYANAYIPRATLGEGFDIPIIQDMDTQLDSQIWETELFDDSAAKELLGHLDNEEGVLPIYLDRLLFMLRSREGKRYVRNVPDWNTRFEKLARSSKSVPLVKLIAIVAYCEASCDPDILSLIPTGLPEGILDDAKKSLCTILSAHKPRDSPRVIALLKPMTTHEVLRKRIFTKDVLGDLIQLLDRTALRSRLSRSNGNFGQAMEGFICLLRCEDTQKTIVEYLGTLDRAGGSKLSQILDVDLPQLLIAALHMVLTLVRILSQETTRTCSMVKSRLEQLARGDQSFISLLATEILLALHDPRHSNSNIFNNKSARANLANALVHLLPEQRNSGEYREDPVLHTLRQLFGLDAVNLNNRHKMLIGELKKAVQTENFRERTRSTMALLKLCEFATIRKHLCEVHLLGLFINQLRYKDKALVAAYALAACLKHDDMMQYLNLKEDENLLKNIVDMLRLDYFDDAMGVVEGFQIFGDLMRYDNLRNKMKNHGVIEILSLKLGNGKLKEVRTSLISLDILRSFDENEPWTNDLISNSLKNLRDPVLKMQKAGALVLSALAGTNHGKLAIARRIVEIVEMLLPEGYFPISQGSSMKLPALTAIVSADQLKPPSGMMGPARALRILAQNRELQHIVRNAPQYTNLRNLHLSGALVGETDRSAWYLKAPNRSDIVDMLDKMIEAIDGRTLQDSLRDLQRRYKSQSRKLDHVRALTAELGRWKRSLSIKMDKLAGLHHKLDCHPDVSRELLFVRHDLRFSQLRMEEIQQQYPNRFKSIRCTITAYHKPQVPEFQRFLIVSEVYTDYAIIQTLHRLNSLVHLTSVFMAKFLLGNHHSLGEEERSPVTQRTSRFVARPLVDCLGTISRDGVALFLPVSFRAYLISRLSHIISSWTMGKEDNILSGLYNQVRHSESQIFSARWRSLAHTNIAVSAYDIDSLVADIVQGLSDVVLAAGCAPPSVARTVISPGFKQKISYIVSTAKILAKLIWNARASGFKPAICLPGQTFDRSSMDLELQHGGAKPVGGGRKVLCTTYLGLMREVVTESPVPGQKNTLALSTVVKAKVLLESSLPNRWG